MQSARPTWVPTRRGRHWGQGSSLDLELFRRRPHLPRRRPAPISGQHPAPPVLRLASQGSRHALQSLIRRPGAGRCHGVHSVGDHGGSEAAAAATAAEGWRSAGGGGGWVQRQPHPGLHLLQHQPGPLPAAARPHVRLNALTFLLRSFQSLHPHWLRLPISLFYFSLFLHFFLPFFLSNI